MFRLTSIVYLNRPFYIFQGNNCAVERELIALWKRLFSNIELHQHFFILRAWAHLVDFEYLW